MTTASALLLRARDPEAEDRRALAEAAEAAGPDGAEWCQLAAVWWQLDERDAAARALERALEHAGEVRVVRNIARLQRTALGDPAAAARALAACEPALMRRGAPADDWRLLAGGWWDAGDRDAALHYLAHAAAAAATSDELCAVGLAYAEIGERAAAHAAIARAAGAADSALAWAAVAKAYGMLGAPDAMDASLASGRERIESTADAVVMADAYASSGGSRADIDVCLARGEALAATDEDRIFVAAAAREHGRSPSRLVPAPPPPPGSRPPAALLRRRLRLLGWPHAPDRLLDRLRGRLGDDRIRGMAALADDRRRMPPSWQTRLPEPFRQMAADECERAVAQTLAALRDIAVTGRVQLPIEGGPLRVVVGERRAGGLDGDDAGGAVDHLARAFVDTLVCIDAAAGAGAHGINSIPPLLESCIALGAEAVDDLVAHLAAMADAYGDCLARSFAELGLVLAAAWLDPADPRLPAAVARLIDDERRRRANPLLVRGDAWLLGLTDGTPDLFEWCALARAILAPPATAELPHLARLAALLADDAEAAGEP